MFARSSVLAFAGCIRAGGRRSAFFVFRIRIPPASTLFPYTTLFRSIHRERVVGPFADREGGRRRDRADQNVHLDRKSTRLNSSHLGTSYAVFCLKKKTQTQTGGTPAQELPTYVRPPGGRKEVTTTCS